MEKTGDLREAGRKNGMKNEREYLYAYARLKGDGMLFPERIGILMKKSLLAALLALLLLASCGCAAQEGGVVRVTVRDTGIGIGPEDLPHVFDRFYKADKSHHSRGTGLGLAIAYEIMKNLGEEMTVTSTLGEGSAFSFTLHTAGALMVPTSGDTAAQTDSIH